MVFREMILYGHYTSLRNVGVFRGLPGTHLHSSNLIFCLALFFTTENLFFYAGNWF